MGSTLKETISLLMNKTCILNFLNEFRELFDQGNISKISDEFERISKTYNTKLAFTSLNKLNNLIKGHKNILPREKRKNVVIKS